LNSTKRWNAKVGESNIPLEGAGIMSHLAKHSELHYKLMPPAIFQQITDTRRRVRKDVKF